MFVAEPRVELEPKSQFSMEKSRVNLDCLYDFIDTRAPASDSQTRQESQFGAQITWKGPAIDSTRFKLSMQSSKLSVEPLARNDSGKYTCQVRVPIRSGRRKLFALSKQAQAKLFVVGPDNNQNNNMSSSNQNVDLDVDCDENVATDDLQQQQQQQKEPLNLWIFQDSGIKVYKLRQDDGSDGEMELIRQLDGHSMISEQVDGNWNQLTLCGGLSPEQAVICEWSDNAIAIKVPDQDEKEGQLKTIQKSSENFDTGPSDLSEENKQQFANGQNLQNFQINGCKKEAQENNNNIAKYRQFIYVGQPNLNRIIVMDARKFEIVSIIQTEPQPRRLHLVKANKPHLSKWIKRRLSQANQEPKQQPFEQNYEQKDMNNVVLNRNNVKRWLLPRRHDKNRLHNDKFQEQKQVVASGQPTTLSNLLNVGQNDAIETTRNRDNNNNMIAAQFDIWLLCYGQPLMVDPSFGSLVADETSPLIPPTFAQQQTMQTMQKTMRVARRDLRLGTDINTWPFAWPPFSRSLERAAATTTTALNGLNEMRNLIGVDKESRLRNRKSVHIVQSTFFQAKPSQKKSIKLDADDNNTQPEWASHELDPESPNYTRPNDAENPIEQFRQSTLISTHRLTISRNLNNNQQQDNDDLSGLFDAPTLTPPAVRDLIQDLTLPERIRALEQNSKYKPHFGYISHYNERRLFRVNLDNYRYEREIDLSTTTNQCDPIELKQSALGLLIIQCRAAISHKLTGQLILDELTTKPIEFNEQIKAQDSYLSPDHKYLISVYTNQQQQTSNNNNNNNNANANVNGNGKNSANYKHKRATVNNNNVTMTPNADDEVQHDVINSIIYVQTMTISGAKFQYEIKTSTLEISECSFVWKDGYYVAIFVSTNKLDQESEILSLRLADGRLELMARVPGLLDSHHRSRHRNQLSIAEQVHLAALSTNQGIFIIDLQENRISQSIQQHQSPPTLLWV